AAGGPAAFADALRREAEAVEAKLPPGSARFDARLGAVEINARIVPARLLALPYVDSLAGPDALPAARHDLLNALARAALQAPVTNLALVPGAWSASIYRLQGRVYLLGQGQKGRVIDVRIPLGRHRAVARRIRATSAGGYAVDLGSLNSAQIARLRLALEPRRHHHAVIRPVRTGPDQPVRPDPAAPSPLLLVGLFCLAAAAVAGLAGWQLYRARD
ncbi:MAG TPA: hypothetical protein VFA78_00795, partial [Chloroflexota bacterium]|nr:hypothetical protein [Chloroflexota bacterium]